MSAKKGSTSRVKRPKTMFKPKKSKSSKRLDGGGGYNNPLAVAPDADSVITISSKTLAYIHQQARDSALVSTTIAQVVSQVMSGGVTVRVIDKAGTWEPNPRMQEYIDTDLKPFMYEGMTVAFVSGVIVWSLTPWKSSVKRRKAGGGVPTMMAPTIARSGYYQLGMRFDGDVRSYEVYRAYRLANGALSGTLAFDNKPDPNTWVTPVPEWAPTSDGMLRSPVCLAMESILKLQDLWEIYTKSLVHYTKPLLVWDTTEAGGYKSYNPIESGGVGVEDISQVMREHTKHQNENAQEDVDVARMYAHFKNRGYSIQRVAWNAATQTPAVSPDSPLYENSYLNPLGHHLSQTVTPSPIPEFSNAIQMLTNTVIEALCTPSNSRTFTTQTRTATADFMFKMYNERVKMLQEQFGFVFSQILKRAWSNIVVEGMQNEYFDMEEEDGPGAGEDSEAEDLLDEEDDFRVEVTFAYTPLTTFETLKNLYDSGVMSHNTFGKYAVRLYGFADEDQMSEKELMKDMQLRKRMAEALMTEAEKMKLQGAKPGGPGGSSAAGSGGAKKDGAKKKENKSSVTGETSVKKKKESSSSGGGSSDPKK